VLETQGLRNLITHIPVGIWPKSLVTSAELNPLSGVILLRMRDEDVLVTDFAPNHYEEIISWWLRLELSISIYVARYGFSDCPRVAFRALNQVLI